MARHPPVRRKAPPSRDAAPIFAALGDATRLKLVSRLCSEGPLSIARLTEGADVTRQAVTKHVRALEEAGMVRERRNGRERLWEIRRARLEEVGRYLEAISAQWDSALARLRAAVER